MKKRVLLKTPDDKNFCIIKEVDNGLVRLTYYEVGKVGVSYQVENKSLKEAINYVKNSDYMEYKTVSPKRL